MDNPVTDPVTGDVVLDAAAAICPATHRRNGAAGEPPCGDCHAAAESAVRAALPRLRCNLGLPPTVDVVHVPDRGGRR